MMGERGVGFIGEGGAVEDISHAVACEISPVRRRKAARFQLAGWGRGTIRSRNRNRVLHL